MATENQIQYAKDLVNKEIASFKEVYAGKAPEIDIFISLLESEAPAHCEKGENAKLVLNHKFYANGFDLDLLYKSFPKMMNRLELQSKIK